MEKYKRFSDEKTGKVPYLTLGSKQSATDLLFAISLIFPRAIAFAVLLGLMFVAGKISAALEAKVAGAILFVLGVSVKVDAKKVQRAKNTQSLILSNFSSYLDFFVLKSLFGSNEMELVVSPTSELSARPSTSFGAQLSHAFTPRSALPTPVATPVALKIPQGPSHLFFEGARTNNTCALAIEPSLSISLFRAVQSQKRELSFVKILHSNKSVAVPNKQAFANFFTSILQLKDEITISILPLAPEDFKVVDNLKMTAKELYPDSLFSVMEKDHKHYRDFLDYDRL